MTERATALAVILLATAVMPCGPLAHADPIDDQTATCAACHGTAGIPIDETIPIIWGQQEGYLYLQLRDFKSGARSNPIMSVVASKLSRDEMLALAAYFAQKTWPTVSQPAASDADIGTARRDIASIGCAACHSDHFQGAGTVPRIAGQFAAYLGKTMFNLRTGARANNPGMTNLMRATPEQDFPALERYLSGL
jgi:cytochrome c553